MFLQLRCATHNSPSTLTSHSLIFPSSLSCLSSTSSSPLNPLLYRYHSPASLCLLCLPVSPSSVSQLLLRLVIAFHLFPVIAFSLPSLRASPSSNHCHPSPSPRHSFSFSPPCPRLYPSPAYSCLFSFCMITSSKSSHLLLLCVCSCLFLPLYLQLSVPVLGDSFLCHFCSLLCDFFVLSVSRPFFFCIWVFLSFFFNSLTPYLIF